MVEFTVAVKTRNRFSLNLKAIAEQYDVPYENVRILTPYVTKQKGDNRYVYSKRKYGDKEKKYVKIDVEILKDVIQASPEGEGDNYPSTGKFVDLDTFYDFIDTYPEFDRINWNLEEITINIEEWIENHIFANGIRNAAGRFYGV